MRGSDGDVAALRWLAIDDAETAWDEFVRSHAEVVLQVVHLVERTEDDRGDCFVYVCERLREHRMRRLRTFDPSGPASFHTWLRVVVRNLCVDWRRSRFGRPRPFRSIARLSLLDREVYHAAYVRGLELGEVTHVVRAAVPGATADDVEESLETIGRALTPTQRWILLTVKPRLRSLASPVSHPDGLPLEDRLAVRARDPEARAADREELNAVREALDALSPADRLLLRLRFEQNLGLARIARMTGLSGDVQAHRRIRAALERLRHTLGETTGRS